MFSRSSKVGIFNGKTIQEKIENRFSQFASAHGMYSEKSILGRKPFEEKKLYEVLDCCLKPLT